MEKETQMTMSEKEKEKEKEILIFIPDDILLDIFSWLPVKSLLRLRWACKYWFDLIRNPSFVKMHFHRSNSNAHDHQDINNTCLFMYKYPLNVVYSVNCRDFINIASSPLKTVQFDYWNLLPSICFDNLYRSQSEHMSGIFFHFEGSCNGLIFLSCFCSSGDEYFLWNPSTREFKQLPYIKSSRDPQHTSVSLSLNGFGYDHTIDDYKVINVYYLRGNESDDVLYSEVNVYTLGSNSWSTRNNINQISDFNLHGNQKFQFQSTSGLLFNGALHWITYSSIVSFDIVGEEHRVLQLPNYCCKGSNLERIYKSSLEVLNGCLCVINTISAPRNEKCLELWMMKDYGVKESCIKLFTIGPAELDPYIFGFSVYWFDLQLINLSKDGEILMVLGEIYLVLYDLKNERITWIHKVVDYSIDHIACAFVKGSCIESLVSLKSGMYLTAAGSTRRKKRKYQVE